LHRKTGGVLLGLQDVVHWKDFEGLGSGDAFKGAFVLTEADITPVDTTAIEVLSAQELKMLKSQSRRVGVLFIYEDNCLKGPATQLRFWQKGDSVY
jgi:hypothetical protein